MRLFVAIEIDGPLRHAAAALATTLRHRALEIAPAAKITWIPLERLHITLRFIGQVTDDRVGAVSAVFGRSVPRRPAAIELAGAGVFPPRGAPTVIWAGVVDRDEALAAIEGDVSGRLESVGFAREKRPFRAHVTLARVREPAGLRAGPLLDGLREVPLGTMTVGAITLFESRLSPQGPQYVAIQRTPLAGAHVGPAPEAG